MGKGSARSLKSALQSQQSRLKKKQQAAQAAQIADQKAKKSSHPRKSISIDTTTGAKGTPRTSSLPQKTVTQPFLPSDKILLIGEGNFSFARALVVHPPVGLEYLPPGNITATAYDTEEECYRKYPDAEAIVTTLRERGVQVLFGVDATRLERTSALKGRAWDRVVWNFPHAGMGITDQDRNIRTNQVLILGFLRSVAKILAKGRPPTAHISRNRKKEVDDEDEELEVPNEDEFVDGDADHEEGRGLRGTVLITLRNVAPYTLWDVPRLAKHPPPPTSGSGPPNPQYALLRSFMFERSFWAGYEHKMTKGERAHGTGTTGEGGEDRTWEFYVKS